jgi:hypothetical protein
VTLIGRLGSTVALGIAAHVLASGGRAEAAGGAFAVEDAEVGTPGSCKVESSAARLCLWRIQSSSCRRTF